MKRLIPVLLCVLLCACRDKAELNERAFVNGIALDKAADGGFNVGVSISDLKAFSGNSGEQKPSKNVKSSDGRTVSEAIRKTERFSGRRLFFAQSRIVVIGEELARDKELFMQALDALERDRELSRKNYAFVCDAQSVEAIGASADGEPSAGAFADKFYSDKNRADAFPMNLEELFIQLRGSGNTLVPKMSAESGELKIGGAAVIKELELAGFIDERLVRGLLWRTENLRGASVTASYRGVNAPFTVLKSACKTSFSDGGNAPIMRLEVKAEGNLSGYSFLKTLNEEEMKELEAAVCREIENEITAAYAELQNKYQADAQDIRGLLKKKSYALWQKYDANWQETFENMRVEACVSAEIASAGRIR